MVVDVSLHCGFATAVVAVNSVAFLLLTAHRRGFPVIEQSAGGY